MLFLISIALLVSQGWFSSRSCKKHSLIANPAFGNAIDAKVLLKREVMARQISPSSVPPAVHFLPKLSAGIVSYYF
jgi:hypothetical protein